MQKVSEVLFPAADAFILRVKYITLCVLDQDSLLLGACFYLPQGSVYLCEIVVCSSGLQAFCFSLPESFPVFFYRSVSDAIQAAVFVHVASKTGSSAELNEF